MKNEISEHFGAKHPEKLEEWNKFNQEVLSNIIKEQQKLVQKANELVDDPRLLVNSFT